MSYEKLVQEIKERNPWHPDAFVLQAAQEILVDDVLKPETRG